MNHRMDHAYLSGQQVPRYLNTSAIAHSPLQGDKFKGLSFFYQIGPQGTRVKGTIPGLGTKVTQLLNKEGHHCHL